MPARKLFKTVLNACRMPHKTILTMASSSSFPIPSSLQDLERSPYNLLPYPQDFADENEAARADSFAELVHLIENGNLILQSAGVALFYQQEEKEEVWNDETRIQALYTLVRKSASLAPSTKLNLVGALCQGVKLVSITLETYASTHPGETISQSFRDAFACHLYMLYTFMFFHEAEQKGSKDTQVLETRQSCATAMLTATQAMAHCRTTLWKRGVPDESVVILPCRIAYPMLESATGVIAKKAACADEAIRMIALSVDSTESLLNTVTAAILDLMHSFEHMAAIAAELCAVVAEHPVNRLAIELIREIGRLEGGDARSSGIKNVAPFISELAILRPKLVLANLSHILPGLNAEPYNMRSAIVTAIAHILEYLGTKSGAHGSTLETLGNDTSAENAPLDVSKSQGALLDLLLERMYDSSSFTRSTVVKAWISLVNSGSLPKDRVIQLTKLTMDRMRDKTVLVRRQAIQLLTSLLEHNPYMGDLDPAPYQQKLADLYEFVRTHLPENIRAAHQDALKEALENGDTDAEHELERAALAAAIDEARILLDDESEELPESQKEFCGKVQALIFTQSALDFIEVFNDADGSLQSMLLSKNTSEVTEALRFFVRARHFHLPCAVTGMKQALALIWSSEQNIRDEVLAAFIDVFIAEPCADGSQLLPDNQIAKNLIVLTGNASVSELASIEEAIIRLVKEEKIPAGVFLILWSIASKGLSDARAAALQLISMGAGADRSIVDSKSRLKLLLDAGLGDFTQQHNDWKLASAAALALQRVRRAEVDPTDAKYLVLERIMEELTSVARGEWCNDASEVDTLKWFSAAEQAIKAVFVVAPEPEVTCQSIILGMAQTTFLEDTRTCHSLRLARFCHVLGQVALNLLVYTETLGGLVRRGNAKQSLKRQEEADKANRNRTEASEEDAIENELGMAAELEAENERKLAEITETEILGNGLIGAFGPLLVRIVGNDGGNFNSAVLMQASTLALCKFMTVSASFCEKHLPLLFTALANAPHDDTLLRANTVVALGDLAFRFPNEVEPYTPRLYACLRDPFIKVRRHTLMVLTHLILNDMVKVKGQVCEIALCLRDNDPRIRDMARLLFHELSKRSNNPVYNLLPDIVSQLSQGSIEKEDFRGIMAFLLGFIKKERQNEMLVDKFCQRFPKCTSISQRGDLAYCIAQLSISEKSVKCLSEHFKLYKDSLYDEDVKKSFGTIVTKAKKLSKPEIRQLIDEWEAKLHELAEVGAENQLAGAKAANAKARASRRAAKKGKTKKMKSIADDKEDDDDDKEDAYATLGKENIRSSARKTRRRRVAS